MAMHAVILAGGSGTRLWPCSQRRYPKQFLDLLGRLSLLQATQARLLPLVSAEHTLVVTGEEYFNLVRKQLPAVPLANILVEPVPRGTAAAIGLAAVALRRHDPAAVMAVLPADHTIADAAQLRTILDASEGPARAGWLVTIGIPPTSPETGYGYIEHGEPIPNPLPTEIKAFRVNRFVEKPDRTAAEALLATERYTWNSGMFVWSAGRILDELAEHMPELHAGLAGIEQSLGTSQEVDTMQRIWHRLANQTIDYGVLEKSQRVAMIPADVGWNDVGSWDAVYDLLPHDDDGNAVIGRHVSLDTGGSLIVGSNRVVVTLGMTDTVIVETEESILVCPRSRSQEVKKLVATLEAQGLADLL